MSVNDFKIEVYNTAGTSVVSQLYIKTDGNIEAEFADPVALKDLITKEFADISYATEDHNHDGTYAPDVHDHDDRYFQETEYVDESAGTADAGKPIILDGNGLISDTMLDVATFIYQGNWTPTAGTEYPDTSSVDIGAFWTIDGLTGDYTFTGGDLAGETISNDDLLIWGTEGWAMTKRDEDMSVYYKLDGSKAITGDFAGGGFQVKNIADATLDTDAMTKGQADIAYAPAGVGAGDFMSDGSVPMMGDFYGGGYQLKDIAIATEDTDAVPKGQADLIYAPSGGSGGYVRIDGTSVMDHSLKIRSESDADTYVLFGRDTDGSFKGGVGCIGPPETVGLLLFDTDGVTMINYLELHADGSTTTSGALVAAGNVSAFSDARLKENIEVIPNALDKIDQVRGVTFDRIDIEDSPRQTGVLAQELQEVLPEAVTESSDGTLSVAYGNVVGLLIEGIKELRAEIKELKGE